MGTYYNILNKPAKYLLGVTLLLFVTTVCAAFSFSTVDDFDLAKQEIMLRKIGHEVLLQAGDSTSRVLPVQKISQNEYQIKFENEFTFQTDSLVAVVTRSLAKNKLAKDYVVNVRYCGSNDVVFGYAISKNKKDDIVACAGRKQRKSCYMIDIKFQPSGLSGQQKSLLVGGIPLLAFVGLLFSKSVKSKRKTEPANANDITHFNIGSMAFNSVQKQLSVNGNMIELTAKENKLLLIFARSPNTIIERARLQKEIWEDEGVIVGRSLDMFISKLRKKLEADATVQLINIHGKGYKLEVAE